MRNDIPIGGVIIWSGSVDKIPPRWHLCDGTEIRPGLTAPNLLGRFVLGCNPTNNNSVLTGGASEVTLSGSQLPSHNHPKSVGSYQSGNGGQSHTHNISTESDNAAGDQTPERGDLSNGTITSNLGGSHNNHTPEVTNYGSVTATSHNNMPPYYSLAYIMRIK